MFPRPEDEEMPPHDDAGGGDDALEQQVLQELQDYAQGGYGDELAQRYGKDVPQAGGEGSPLEEMGESPAEEDAEIPGIEPDSEATDSAGGIDPEKLKALLASLKAGV